MSLEPNNTPANMMTKLIAKMPSAALSPQQSIVKEASDA
jgi:hypothetical protein